ncbi:acyltransferase family protein [Microbacterium sp. P06]|uniref:acyltransferase family protein n=1 Tax=Microbacterium sp. P06 TaxID=3366949 RepID=UPI0037450C7A
MSTLETSSRTPVRRDIQGLRALAVVAVVLAHLIGWPRGGFAGVDVFFVVSGFLITGLLLRELSTTGRISLRDFYARRIRRILPAAILVLLAVAVAAFFVFNRTRADRTLWDAVAAFALVANWRFAAEGTDYFHAADAVSPLQHFWSLSVEEQFYLVWPGLLLLLVLFLPAAARRTGAARGVVAAAALVIVAASGGWAMVQTAADPTVAYFSTATRAWELGLGALVAVAAPVLGRLPAALRWVMGWVGGAAVVWSFFVLDPDTMPFPAPWAILPVGAAVLVIAGGVGGDPRQRHLFPLTNPISVFVGDLSYSLYLWHFPVIVFAAVLLPVGAEATPVIAAAIVVLSVSAYFLVEQPLHRSPWLRRKGGREAVSADAAVPTAPSPRPAPAPTSGARLDAAPANAAPRLSSTRPEGWTPGTRYYPGARPRPAENPAPAQIEATREAAASIASSEPQPAALERRVAAEPASEPASQPAVESTVDRGRTAGPSPWAAWRARFRPQFGLGFAGLGIGAGVVVLLTMVSFGSPVIGPLLPPPGEVAVAPAEDPTSVVQGELAAAVSATEWPALRPSLDEVMQRSSSANPARDCFSPSSGIDLGRCTWGDGRAARHMYLVGDSSALAYAPAFKKLAEESGGAWRITTVGMYGCRFTDVLVQNDGAGVMAACPQRKLDVRSMIAANPADLIVVSNAYTLAHTIDGRNLTEGDLLRGSQAEASTYGAPGRIVYLAPPPKGGDLSRCYSPVSAPANCATAVDPTWHNMEAAAESIAAASGDHAIGSLGFSCWQEICPAFAAGMPIRYDESHFTVAYAEHIVPVLRADLAATGLF